MANKKMIILIPSCNGQDPVDIVVLGIRNYLIDAYMSCFKWAHVNDYDLIFEIDSDSSCYLKYLSGFIKAPQDAGFGIGSRIVFYEVMVIFAKKYQKVQMTSNNHCEYRRGQILGSMADFKNILINHKCDPFLIVSTMFWYSRLIGFWLNIKIKKND